MFVGRKQELSQLRGMLNRPNASLIVIRGRRRIGKSRLIKEFSKSFNSYSFMGLPPTEATTANDQRNEFIRQFKQQFSFGISSNDWGDLFTSLAKQCRQGRVIIVLDEISWMATGDPHFLSKLKTVWDLHFSENPELILILCGSVSAWIEKNLLSSTGFLGRPTLHMTIDELPLHECYQFWKNKQNVSTFEIFKVLSVTGGIPRYLELFDLNLSAEDNIRNLCFNPNAPLFDEFKYIFSDIYGKRNPLYQRIVSQLEDTKAAREELIQAAELSHGGEVTEYLNDLEVGGFIEKETTWNIASKKLSKLSYYQLKDNYTRFYLKYILPNKAKIEKGLFENVSVNNLAGWNTILGLQFENLVIKNDKKMMKLLSIKPEDVVQSGPYFQRQTKRQKGCQIDYMIQTKHDVIYIVEIKFRRNEITKDIILEMQEKIQRLKVPKYISRRPILIHVNGVKDEVLDADYFSAIINFSDFLVQE
jgi:AAA+ ATPase superfamily predicted ATPase